eukprot:4813156-Prymnesium_polylepis.1
MHAQPATRAWEGVAPRTCMLQRLRTRRAATGGEEAHPARELLCRAVCGRGESGGGGGSGDGGGS